MPRRSSTADEIAGNASSVSWGAVLVGGLVAVIVGAGLNLLGGPGPGQTRAGVALGLSGGIWPEVVNLISFGLGGFVAARLAGGSDSLEHGLLACAAGLVVSAMLLGHVATSTGDVLARPPIADSIEDPAVMTSDQRQAEMAHLIGDSVMASNFDPATRDRIALLTVAEFDITVTEADLRLQLLEAAAARLEREAQVPLEAPPGMLGLVATLLLGAAAAVLGARLGSCA